LFIFGDVGRVWEITKKKVVKKKEKGKEKKKILEEKKKLIFWPSQNRIHLFNKTKTITKLITNSIQSIPCRVYLTASLV